jgi:hypothetical protein
VQSAQRRREEQGRRDQKSYHFKEGERNKGKEILRQGY